MGHGRLPGNHIRHCRADATEKLWKYLGSDLKQIGVKTGFSGQIYIPFAIVQLRFVSKASDITTHTSVIQITDAASGRL